MLLVDIATTFLVKILQHDTSEAQLTDCDDTCTTEMIPCPLTSMCILLPTSNSRNSRTVGSSAQQLYRSYDI